MKRFTLSSKTKMTFGFCLMVTGLTGVLACARRRFASQSGDETSRKMQLAVEHSPVSIVITDRDGVIEYVNPKFTQVTGYTSAEAVGKNARVLKTGTTPDELYRQLWDQIRCGGEWHGEILNKKKNGEFFWESVGISPIKNPSGEITHYLAVKEDITARKELEQELRSARDAAEAANRQKGKFLANMSHEIRTPMNGVLGMTELLRDTGLTGEQSEYVQALKSSAESLMTVINDIFDFSGLESRQLALECVGFELRRSLDLALNPQVHLAHEKGLRLAVRVDPSVPDALLGDQGRLGQILVNLVSNAIKFTESGEVAVCVAAEAVSESEAFLAFAVADTGIGIPAQMQRSVFEPFSQVDASATRRYGGTGLGLTIAARLVEMMGGTLGVESEPGRGSSFHFTLRLGLLPDFPVPEVPEVLEVQGPEPGPEPEPAPAAAAIFDRKETLARMDGDWELFREVAGIFAADSRAMMQQIRNAIAAADSPGLHRAAHTLKGAVSNFGARASFDLALKLEQLGKSGEFAGAWDRFADLERELERLREALEDAGRTGK
jgi:two-component system, sensor histidine kinase and response regulator